MNTAGIKEYTCPSCKQPITKLESNTFKLILGLILTFLSLPGVFFGLAIFIAVITSGDIEIGALILGVFLLCFPSIFAVIGLNLVLRAQNTCPHCGIRLHKAGVEYITHKEYKRALISNLRSMAGVKQEEPSPSIEGNIIPQRKTLITRITETYRGMKQSPEDVPVKIAVWMLEDRKRLLIMMFLGFLFLGLLGAHISLPAGFGNYLIAALFLIIGALGVISIFFRPKSINGVPVSRKVQFALVILFLFFGWIGIYLISPEFAFSIFRKIASIFYSP